MISARRPAVLGTLLLCALAECRDQLPVQPYLDPPSNFVQTLAWVTDTIVVTCPGTNRTALIPKRTLWLPLGAVAPESLVLRLSPSTDTTACGVSRLVTAQPGDPAELVGVSATDTTLSILLQGRSLGRTTYVVMMNGKRVDVIQTLTASAEYSALAIGHRGAGWLWPENTLVSIRMAASAGLRMAQAPVRLTEDTVPVLMHDSTVDRTTDGHGLVADLPSSYVLALHAAPSFGPAFANELVPSLERALAAADSLGIGMMLEIAWQQRVSVAAQAAAIAAAIRRAGPASVILTSVDTEFLSVFHHMQPSATLALNPDSYGDWQGPYCARTGIQTLLYWPATLEDPRALERIRELAGRGYSVYMVTTNNLAFADSVAAVMPLSGILSDVPPLVFALGKAAR